MPVTHSVQLDNFDIVFFTRASDDKTDEIVDNVELDVTINGEVLTFVSDEATEKYKAFLCSEASFAEEITIIVYFVNDEDSSSVRGDILISAIDSEREDEFETLTLQQI